MIENASIEVRVVDDYKGHGIFATRDFKRGEVILEEKPLVSCQFAWNAAYGYLACDHCMRPLEDAQENVRRLMQEPAVVLPHMECCATNKQSHCECDRCQVKYCSPECLAEAQGLYHHTLCTIAKPLEKLMDIWKQMHYPPETTSAMLLARIIATVLQAPNQAEVLSWYMQMCHKVKNEAEGLNHKLLGERFTEQKELLRESLKQIMYADCIQEWFTPDGFDTLMAMVGTNGQGIGTSPFSKWVENLNSLEMREEEEEEVDHLISNLYERMHNIVGEFLNTEGSGLYRVQSKINHDCNPNAKSKFLHGNFILSIVARRNISVGEEICVSYLDSCLLRKRQYHRNKKLKENYLFTCKCARCLSESGDVERTSSEGEEDSEDCEYLDSESDEQ